MDIVYLIILQLFCINGLIYTLWKKIKYRSKHGGLYIWKEVLIKPHSNKMIF